MEVSGQLHAPAALNSNRTLLVTYAKSDVLNELHAL